MRIEIEAIIFAIAISIVVFSILILLIWNLKMEKCKSFCIKHRLFPLFEKGRCSCAYMLPNGTIIKNINISEIRR